MTRHLDAEPATDAELFDMLHGLFGIGDYDEATPWFKHRGIEIAKLKAIRKRRGITLREYAAAARYCYRKHILITASHQVCKHIADANKDARARAVPAIEAAIDQAVQAERQLGESTWIPRLLNARGPYRTEVYEAWRRERGA